MLDGGQENGWEEVRRKRHREENHEERRDLGGGAERAPMRI